MRLVLILLIGVVLVLVAFPKQPPAPRDYPSPRELDRLGIGRLT